MQFAERCGCSGVPSKGARLADARARETAAAAHVAEVEASLERQRLELMEADGRTTAAREAAHASELEIGRLQQQIAFDKQQVESLAATASDIQAEVQTLEARREPARIELDTRREAGARAIADRDAAAETLHGEEAAYADQQRNIEGLEADVEAARSEVFAAVNAATALRHAMEHAMGARTRLAEQIGRLDIERRDLTSIERAARERNSQRHAGRSSPWKPSPGSATRESERRARAAIATRD